MFHCLYYFFTTNESSKNFKVKKIAASYPYFNFPVKLICGGTVVFRCLDKSMPIIVY